MVTELAANHAKGIYRAIVTRPGPQETLLMSSRLWPRYYDKGESIVEFPNDNSARKRIVACRDLPRGHECLLMPYYAELVRQALVVPKVRKATKPTRASREKRLDHKSHKQNTKRLRKNVRSWD